MHTLGKYQIHSKLGSGTFGTVYRASDPVLDRDVAIKVLHPHLQSNTAVLARFKREAIAIARLRHPNIVLIYSAETLDSMETLVMEYVAGGTLKDMIPSTGMSLAQAMPLIEKMADALNTAHAQGVLHRDIKPANILIEHAHQRVVLTDFGLAKLGDLEGLSGSTGGVIGTPEYIAPELWDEDGEASRASDVYALGCVAYEMLTGKALFGASKRTVIMRKHTLEGAKLDALPNTEL